MRRKMERPVVDLPHPDSPTIPKISPSFKLKLTLSTAFTTPLKVWKYVFNPCTSNNTLSSIPHLLFQIRVQLIS